MDFVSFLGLAKKRACIFELRFKGRQDFRAHFIAAAANARPNGFFQISWPAAKPSLHFSDTLFYNSLGRPTPSCVKDTDRSPPFIYEDYWQAVGCKDAEQNPGSTSNQAVSGKRVLRRL